MDSLINDGFIFWHWWVLGFLLLIAEVLTPGTFFMWIGAAAFVTGIAAWLLPGLSWAGEIVLFALLSLTAVGAWFKFRPMRRSDDADNGLNQRGRQVIGRELTLVSNIENGVGQARLDDSVWRVTGPELPSGTQVRVVGTDGATLQVKPVNHHGTAGHAH
ncbi:MAG: NfeD family protein [Gammaproteobacteria bacterium]|jgi:inner membrane protein|nr:NfeD family protein [Gammaproteobacteria bacterium]